MKSANYVNKWFCIFREKFCSIWIFFLYFLFVFFFLLKSIQCFFVGSLHPYILIWWMHSIIVWSNISSYYVNSNDPLCNAMIQILILIFHKPTSFRPCCCWCIINCWFVFGRALLAFIFFFCSRIFEARAEIKLESSIVHQAILHGIHFCIHKELWVVQWLICWLWN